MQDIEGDIPAWMDRNTYAEIAADGAQQLVLEDMADNGVDPDMLNNKDKHGYRHKAREWQAAVIRNLMGPTGCKWSAPDRHLADALPEVPIVLISNRTPSDWKNEVDCAKTALLESCHNQDIDI